MKLSSKAVLLSLTLAASASLAQAQLITKNFDVTGVSNAVVALSPSGELVASYRKLHLYDAFGSRESDWVEPGEVTIDGKMTVKIDRAWNQLAEGAREGGLTL